MDAIPLELTLSISSHFDLFSIIFLASTCKHLYQWKKDILALCIKNGNIPYLISLSIAKKTTKGVRIELLYRMGYNIERNVRNLPTRQNN